MATDVGTSFIDDPADIVHFEALLDRLDEISLDDAAARNLLKRVAKEYRTR